MNKKSPRNTLTAKWSRLKKEGKGAVISGLGFVPGLGTALNIHDTAVKTIRTARAGRELSEALTAELRRRLRR